MEQKPSVGRIVHYQSYGSPGGEYKSEHRAAIITGVVNDTTAGPYLGTGLSNTNMIVASEGAGTTYAAGLARAYTGGGYTNWYLPSEAELLVICSNKNIIGTTFNRAYYWTSTEDDAYNAYKRYFGNNAGSPSGPSDKSFAQAGVRAIRSF